MDSSREVFVSMGLNYLDVYRADKLQASFFIVSFFERQGNAMITRSCLLLPLCGRWSSEFVASLFSCLLASFCVQGQFQKRTYRA